MVPCGLPTRQTGEMLHMSRASVKFLAGCDTISWPCTIILHLSHQNECCSLVPPDASRVHHICFRCKWGEGFVHRLVLDGNFLVGKVPLYSVTKCHRGVETVSNHNAVWYPIMLDEGSTHGISPGTSHPVRLNGCVYRHGYI